MHGLKAQHDHAFLTLVLSRKALLRCLDEVEDGSVSVNFQLPSIEARLL